MKIALMSPRVRKSRWKSAIAFFVLALTACAPVGRTIDNPKEGQKIDLVVEQPLRIMLTNNKGPDWDWTWTQQPLRAVKADGASIRPAEGGGLEQHMFDFTAVSAGADSLIFAYRQQGAAPAPDDEVLTVTVAVK